MPWIAIELRPPGPGLRHPPGSSPPARPPCRQPTPAGAHRHPAHISRIEAGQVSRGVTTPVPCVYLPASLTGPAHRAVLNRLDFVAAASTLPGIPQVRLPPASNPRLPWQGDKVSHVHPKHQRLVAQHKDLTGSRVGYTTADSAHSQPYITPATPCRATSHPGPSSIPPGQSLFPDAALDAAESVDRSRGADCSAPVTPTKRVGCSNKRVAAVDSASACFPWIVARGEALR